jgi:predicted Zn finger-like uncharacterized protein
MRIRCPSCSATYEVPDALLDPPRTVRCARCAHDWMAEALEEPVLAEAAADTPTEASEAEVPAAAAAEPIHELVREPVEARETVFDDTPLSAIERLSEPGDLSPQIQRRDRLLTAAWAASFAILTALSVAGYTERDSLMRQWPASKRVYATLGLVPMDRQTGDGKSAEPTGSSGQRPVETPPR